jgi:hypothetical protein
MFGQSLAEYGMRERVIAGVDLLIQQTKSALGQVPPQAWLILGCIVLASIWFWQRRPKGY